MKWGVDILLLSLTSGFFDKIALDRVPDAEKAIYNAIVEIPAAVIERLDTATTLSDEDRKIILDIIQETLKEFLPKEEERLAEHE